MPQKEDLAQTLIFKLCLWLFLRVGPCQPWVQAAAAEEGLPQVQLAVGFTWLHTRLHGKDCSRLFGLLPFFRFPLLHFFSFTLYFTQISFFASLLPRLLHQAGCPTSLSSASVCSPADPGFFLAPTHLRARHRLCFLLYRSNSPSVK